MTTRATAGADSAPESVPARRTPQRQPPATGAGVERLSGLRPAAMLAIQRSAGNRAARAMLARSGQPPTRVTVQRTGGTLVPGDLSPGMTEFSSEVQATKAQSATAAAGVLAAAGSPHSPAAAATPTLRDPRPPSVAAPTTSAPMPVGGADAAIATDTTKQALAQQESQTGSAFTRARADVAAQADGVALPAIESPKIEQPPKAPLLPGTPTIALPADAAFPVLEPEVAKVLDAGFGPKLAAQAAAARAEHAGAVDRHASLVDQAHARHDGAVTAEQATADATIAQVRTQTTGQVNRLKTGWIEQAGQIETSAKTELSSARAGTAAEVDRHAGDANAQANQLLQQAREQARAAQGATATPNAPPVQRSWWSSVTDAVGGAVNSVGEGLSSLGAAARGIAESALSKAKGLFDSARAVISAKVAAFAQAARGIADRIGRTLADAGRAAMSGINAAITAARSTITNVAARIKAAGSRLLGTLSSAIGRAGSWLWSKGKAVVNKVVAAGRAVWELAGKVRQFLRVTGIKVLGAAVDIVEDPRAFIAPYQAKVAGMIDTVPAKAQQMYDAHVAPLFAGGPAATAAVGNGPPVQRQAVPGGPTTASPDHGAIVWEYLKQRLSYLGANWGSVILDALFEIFVPFVTFYRHLPPLLKSVWQGLKDLLAGNYSDAIDNGLKAARELMAILGTLFAQFSIVAFIAGSILGTPIIGEAAMVAIGLSLLGADAVVQGASIWAARANLDHPGRKIEQLDGDYGTIADSILSLGITLALIVIAAVGQKLGKVLLARFPRIGVALEEILARLRRTARGKPPLVEVPTVPDTAPPVVDVPKPPAVAPPAVEFPGRAGLSPADQLAFDRFIAARRANGMSPEFEAKLKGSTPDQLRGLARREIANQADIEQAQQAADRAKATNASDRLNPDFAHSADKGGGVRTRWNETESLPTEIDQAKAVAAATGEPIELYGDGYRGIDGRIGDRPFQLKGVPAGDPPLRGPVGVYRSAVVARQKAISGGFNDVEVHIVATEMTRAQIAAEFNRPSNPGTYLDGAGTRKVVIHCANGEVFTPTPSPVIPPPVHIDSGEEKQDSKAKATAGAAN